MAEPMAEISPEKLNAAPKPNHAEDDIDTTNWHDPPSSPFESHVADQENVAPKGMTTPSKPASGYEDEPQSAFKVSPERKSGLKERTSPMKMSLEFEEDSLGSPASRMSPKKSSPAKQIGTERRGSATSSRSRRSSPTKTSRNPSPDSTRRAPALHPDDEFDVEATPSKLSSSTLREDKLRENEGLTVAMRLMEQTRGENLEHTSTPQRHNVDINIGDATFDDTDFGPDGPEFTSMDDTSFSMFSEMPGMDMTTFAALRQSPTKNGLLDQV